MIIAGQNPSQLQRIGAIRDPSEGRLDSDRTYPFILADGFQLSGFGAGYPLESQQASSERAPIRMIPGSMKIFELVQKLILCPGTLPFQGQLWLSI